MYTYVFCQTSYVYSGLVLCLCLGELWLTQYCVFQLSFWPTMFCTFFSTRCSNCGRQTVYVKSCWPNWADHYSPLCLFPSLRTWIQHLHVSFFTVQYYTCKEEKRCPKLLTVYGQDEKALYQRTVNDQIVECDGKTPASGNCTVCRDKVIYIICPVETVPKDAEDNKGQLELTTIHPPGMCYTTILWFGRRQK